MAVQERRTTTGMSMMSNEPTKTKKAMKKTMRFLSIAALALVGAMMTSCSSNEDNFIDTPKQTVNTSNVVTLTTTVGLDEGAEARGTTRALNIDYVNKQAVKTFAEGETMAVVYKNTNNETVKAVSELLTDGDITSGGKSANFTFELTDPDKTQNVTYIYPAAMAKDDGTVNYDALATQNGTLATLSSSLDLGTYSGAWSGTSLPTGTLANPLAVCALTLKNSDGSSTITSGLTEVTVSDGTNTYTVAPTGSTFGVDTIYVAIRPVTAALEYTATNGTTNYTKTATSRAYAAGNFYKLGLRMAEVVPAGAINGKFSVSSTKKVYFSQGNLQYKAKTHTWRFAEHQYDYVGDASHGNVYVGTGKSNNANISSTYNGWIDLFGWGTSGHEFASGYGTAYLPWSTSDNDDDYGPTDGTSSLTGDFAEGDWGINIGSGWRTLTSDEWYYLLKSRTCSTVNGTANARFCKAKLFNTTYGIILFPDDYTHPDGVAAPEGINYDGSTSWAANTYSTEAWAKMEEAGCVFLPAAGYRYYLEGWVISGVNLEAYYWSSTAAFSNMAYSLRFYSTDLLPGTSASARHYGCCVRLVHE